MHHAMRRRSGTAGALDEALEELYSSPLGAFTQKRDELAKALKAKGDAEAAAVRSRRKPTQVAYVLNQLARRNADDVAELVEVGRDLARVQRRFLRGEHAAGLREAIARQREIVGKVTRKAAALMNEVGISAPGHLDELAGSLQAALVDPAVGAMLEEKAPAAAAGFSRWRPAARARRIAKAAGAKRTAAARARDRARALGARAKRARASAARAAKGFTPAGPTSNSSR